MFVVGQGTFADTQKISKDGLRAAATRSVSSALAGSIGQYIRQGVPCQRASISAKWLVHCIRGMPSGAEAKVIPVSLKNELSAAATETAKSFIVGVIVTLH